MKSNYIFMGIIAVGIVGVGAFFAMGNKDSQPAQPGEVTQTEVAGSVSTATDTSLVAADGSFSGSLYDLAKSGEAYQCTVSHSVQGITSNGVVYISGENIKAEFSSTVPVIGSVKTQMIADKDFVYTWTSVAPQGYKAPRVEQTANAQVQTSSQGIDFNQKLDYNCVGWSADMSVFTLPAGVTFKSV